MTKTRAQTTARNQLRYNPRVKDAQAIEQGRLGWAVEITPKIGLPFTLKKAQTRKDVLAWVAYVDSLRGEPR